MDNIMTFEALYEVVKQEKTKPELQKLNADFFSAVVKYLDEKSAILDSQRKDDALFVAEAEKTRKQLENIRKMIHELFERRENKILQLALFSSRLKEKQDLSMLLPEEKVMYEELLALLNENRKGVLDNLLAKKLPVALSKPKSIKKDNSEHVEEHKLKGIRFLHAVPQFVDEELNVYGPFEEEDIGLLPRETAKVLIQKKRAEEVQIEKNKENKKVLPKV